MERRANGLHRYVVCSYALLPSRLYTSASASHGFVCELPLYISATAGAQMVLTLKMISAAVCYHDGLKSAKVSSAPCRQGCPCVSRQDAHRTVPLLACFSMQPAAHHFSSLCRHSIPAGYQLVISVLWVAAGVDSISRSTQTGGCAKRVGMVQLCVCNWQLAGWSLL